MCGHPPVRHAARAPGAPYRVGQHPAACRRAPPEANRSSSRRGVFGPEDGGTLASGAIWSTGLGLLFSAKGRAAPPVSGGGIHEDRGSGSLHSNSDTRVLARINAAARSLVPVLCSHPSRRPPATIPTSTARSVRSSSQSIRSSAKARLRIAPELSDPVGSLEVGEHEDVEEFGAGSRSESIEALPKSALELVGSHGRSIKPPQRSTTNASIRGGSVMPWTRWREPFTWSVRGIVGFVTNPRGRSCAICGTRLKPGVRVCPSCGTRRASPCASTSPGWLAGDHAARSAATTWLSARASCPLAASRPAPP